MDLELSGKTAIVTGGSRGIGKAIASELSREGVDVILVARGREMLETTAAELAQNTDREIVPITADTGDDSQVHKMVLGAAKSMGHIDILVNCAAKPALQRTSPMLSEITDSLFWEDVNVKVMGYLRCAREVAPYMRQQGWGRIINISGLAAKRTGSIIGSIRNIAVVAMSNNLADELGPFGINVNVVHPGFTRTEATPGVIEERANVENVSLQEMEKRMANTNSSKRIIDANEIAYVVAFLASPKSAAITGDSILDSGGNGPAINY
mgnify:CR=1 FL=1